MANDLEKTGAKGQVKPKWINNDPALGVLFAFVLIALYVLPVYMIGTVAWLTGGFQEDSALFEWFAAFMKSADTTLSQFHKILMPVLTALSVIVMSGRPTKLLISLVIFLLISFAVTIGVSVTFDMDKMITALEGLSEPIDLKLVRSFFVRIQETLLVYLMLLLGLGVSGVAKAGK